MREQALIGRGGSPERPRGSRGPVSGLSVAAGLRVIQPFVPEKRHRLLRGGPRTCHDPSGGDLLSRTPVVAHRAEKQRDTMLTFLSLQTDVPYANAILRTRVHLTPSRIFDDEPRLLD
jgi:hypothetical protein